MTITDEAGTTLTSSTTSTNDEFATFSASAGTKTYYIGVENVASNPIEAPYLFYINNALSCAEDSYEPNNSPAQAKALSKRAWRLRARLMWLGRLAR